jgi:hypothetical protein
MKSVVLFTLLIASVLVVYVSSSSLTGFIGTQWVIAGSFNSATQSNGEVLEVSNVALYNGTGYESLGGGANGVVNKAYVDTCGNTYVGGAFTTLGGQEISMIAVLKYGAATFTKLGDYTVNNIGQGVIDIHADCFNKLDVSGKGCSCDVYIAGDFTMTFTNAKGDEVQSFNVAKYDYVDKKWDNLNGKSASGIDLTARQIYKKPWVGDAGDYVYVAGDSFFNRYDTDTKTWKLFMDSDVFKGSFYALYYDSEVLSTDKMYLAGNIEFPVSSDTDADTCVGVCAFNHKTFKWSKVSSEDLNGPVNALGMNGDTLYAGGSFNAAGSTSLSGLAKLDGSNWKAISDSDATQIISKVLSIDVCTKISVNCEAGSVSVGGREGLAKFYNTKTGQYTTLGDGLSNGNSEAIINSVAYRLNASSSIQVYSIGSLLVMLFAIVFMML